MRSRMGRSGSLLIALLRDESGQNLFEYGLIVGLLGLATIASTTNMTTQLKAAFNTMGSALAQYV